MKHTIRKLWNRYKFCATLVCIIFGVTISGFLTGFNNEEELSEILEGYPDD